MLEPPHWCSVSAVRNLHNIEKSGFHHGQYVGYAGGRVWRIRQTQFGGWKWAAQARKPSSPEADESVAIRYADTLDEMSRQLDK